MMTDLWFGVRALIRRPGSSLLIAGLLAIGIGSITTMFSLFDAVLSRPLPVPRPDELVRIVQHLPKIGSFSSFPYAYYEMVHSRAKSFGFLFGEAGNYYHYVMSSPLPPEQISLRAVTPDFFVALGVEALYGRVLRPDDAEGPPGTPPAVLSYNFWRRHFQCDPHAVNGSIVTVNGHYFTIVGVMPSTFNGIAVDSVPDMWIPFNSYKPLAKSSGDTMELELAGRSKPGVPLSELEAECLTVWQSTMKDYYQGLENRPEDEALELVRRGVQVEPLSRGTSIVRDSFAETLKLMMASLSLLVILVCLNIGGILLARAAGRQHEFAVRLAIGANRIQLIKQLLAESSVLAFLGFTGGLLITILVAPTIVQFLPPMRDLGGSLVPLSLQLSVSGRVFAFALLISLCMLLIFSVSPIAAALDTSTLNLLLRGTKSSTRTGGRQALICLEVALCTFLLVIAGLFARTLRHLQVVDPGFNRVQIATFTGDLSGRTDADSHAFLRTLTERVRKIPGVSSTALSSVGLMRGRGISWTIAPAGQQITHADFLDANGNHVSPEYFETMGMPIILGRGFVGTDEPEKNQASPVMAIVNQAFAEKFFPNIDPIGKRFGTGVNGVAGANFHIIGVVRNAKYRSLREPIIPTFYTFETPVDLFVLNVKTQFHPEAVIKPVQEALASIDTSMAFLEVHTMEEEVRNSVANEHLIAILAAVFATTAVSFVGAGVYGMLEYLTTQRRREIGICMALGAQSFDIAKRLSGRTALVIGSGVILGLSGAFLAAPAIRSMLYDTSAQDPASMADAALFVAFVAVLAVMFPVIRAIRTKPAEVLRYDN